MTVQALKMLTADEYFAWAERRPEKRPHYELLRGKLVEMAPEKVLHARVKNRLIKALEAAGADALGLEVLPDGVSV